MNKLTNKEFVELVEKKLNKKSTYKSDLKAISCLYKLIKTSQYESEQVILNKLVNKYVSIADMYDFAKLTNQTKQIGNKNVIMTCGTMSLSTVRALDYISKDGLKDNYILDAYWGSLANDVRNFEQTK